MIPLKLRVVAEGFEHSFFANISVASQSLDVAGAIQNSQVSELMSLLEIGLLNLKQSTPASGTRISKIKLVQ